jgi:hypothetical protein
MRTLSSCVSLHKDREYMKRNLVLSDDRRWKWKDILNVRSLHYRGRIQWYRLHRKMVRVSWGFLGGIMKFMGRTHNLIYLYYVFSIWYYTDRVGNTVQQYYYVHLFVVGGTSFESRCLATIRGHTKSTALPVFKIREVGWNFPHVLGVDCRSTIQQTAADLSQLSVCSLKCKGIVYKVIWNFILKYDGAATATVRRNEWIILSCVLILLQILFPPPYSVKWMLLYTDQSRVLRHSVSYTLRCFVFRSTCCGVFWYAIWNPPCMLMYSPKVGPQLYGIRVYLLE